MEVHGIENVTIESVYGLIQKGLWNHALHFIHASDERRSDDARMMHLTETFVSEFFRHLPTFDESAVADASPMGPMHLNGSRMKGGASPFIDDEQAEAAERIVLFHKAGRLVLSSGQFSDLILRLIGRNSHQIERALDFARFLPDHPVCRRLLQPFTTPEKRSSPSVQNTGVHLTEQVTAATGGAVLGLFRSNQEKNFYEAVRQVYPRLLAIPNVSLHAIVSLPAVRSSLTARERDYFFRALIDCVLFDPENDHRPEVCFELDSPFHDDDRQIERDSLKDRILSLAGLRLIRLRPDHSGVGTDAYRTVLETIGSFSKPPRLE